MSILTDKKFWINTAERAIKTFVESLVSMLTVGSRITDFDWLGILSVSATATLISVCINIGAALTKNKESE